MNVSYNHAISMHSVNKGDGPQVTVSLKETNATNTKTPGVNDFEYKSTFYSVLTRDIHLFY
jgi:hypothetical protein